MGKAKPTNSFDQLLARQTIAKFDPHIQQSIQRQLQEVLPEVVSPLQESIQALYFRIIALERILMQQGVSGETIAAMVAEVEDSAYGYVEVDRATQLGDSVRLTLAVKPHGEDYTDPTKHLLRDVGSGVTLGEHFESNLIGMQKGETKEFAMLGENPPTAKVTIDSISAKVAQ